MSEAILLLFLRGVNGAKLHFLYKTDLKPSLIKTLIYPHSNKEVEAFIPN
jgi:hypothetical protein